MDHRNLIKKTMKYQLYLFLTHILANRSVKLNNLERLNALARFKYKQMRLMVTMKNHPTYNINMGKNLKLVNLAELYNLG